MTLTLPKIAADGGVPSIVDTETGELQERRLEHRAEAGKFYRDLAAQGMKVRVGMEGEWARAAGSVAGTLQHMSAQASFVAHAGPGRSFTRGPVMHITTPHCAGH